MKTPLQGAAAYLQARADADDAARDGKIMEHAFALGQQRAYADMLELDETTFIAPEATPDPRLKAEAQRAGSGYSEIVIFVPRNPDALNPHIEIGFFVREEHAVQLRDALIALDLPGTPATSEAQGK